MASRRHTTDLSDEYRNIAIWAGIYYPLIIVLLVALCHGSLDEVEKQRSQSIHPAPSNSKPAHILLSEADLSVDDDFTLGNAPQAGNESRTDRQASTYARVGSDPQPRLETTTTTKPQHKREHEHEHEVQSLSSSISESPPDPIEAAGFRKRSRGTQTEVEPSHIYGEQVAMPFSQSAPLSLLISSATSQSLQFIPMHRMGYLAAQVVRETSEPPVTFVLVLGFATFVVMLSSGKFNEFWEAERSACREVLMQRRIRMVLNLNLLGFLSMFVPWYLLIMASF